MCAAFSCFADLALTSPDDYYKEGEGSLMQCVLTPADPFLPMSNEQIAEITHQQVQSPPGLARARILSCDLGSQIGPDVMKGRPGVQLVHAGAYA